MLYTLNTTESELKIEFSYCASYISTPPYQLFIPYELITMHLLLLFTLELYMQLKN